MRVLVSGFEPFGQDLENPTASLVAGLAGRANVRAVLLPVTFADAFARLEAEIAEFKPDVVLSLGLAGGRSAKIEIERVAINCIDAEIPDNAGVQHRDQAITVDGHNAYFSTLPIALLADALRSAGVPVGVSNSAGTYVCNFLFYRLQELLAGTVVRSGFVHFPYLPEQAAQKTPVPPSMSLEVMRRGLDVMIAAL